MKPLLTDNERKLIWVIGRAQMSRERIGDKLADKIVTIVWNILDYNDEEKEKGQEIDRRYIDRLVKMYDKRILDANK